MLRTAAALVASLLALAVPRVVDFSLGMRLDTFLRMHERAFAFFGGSRAR